jgi:hypothetical protein
VAVVAAEVAANLLQGKTAHLEAVEVAQDILLGVSWLQN